ncbi:hypothetical protein SFRURICE_009441 [Spodoptera frugiperda]|nr:hypothetical protein SFRURICE_009441 [Spodoptera frugiperda]
MQSLNELTGQKAVIKGLFVLLTAKQVVELSKKYIPNDFSINWGDTDQTDIIMRKNIAKHLYIARPLVPLDTVLWYAKGDYLQYSVPSLNAMIPNLDVVESEEYLPKLLNAPVSLQKFGLHLAFRKFKPNELKSIFSNVWNSSNNSSIRGVVFEHTYNQICIVKHESTEKDLWQLLSMFIDNLSSEESAAIHKKLSEVAGVPVSIRGDYYMKSYEYLTSLPESADCKKYVNNLLSNAHIIMEFLDEDFVVNKLLSPAVSKYDALYEHQYVKSLACFILCGRNEENQVQRFKKIIPVIDDFFQNWDSIESDDSYQTGFDQFLSFMVNDFIDYFERKKLSFPIPAKVFAEILSKIENDLSVSENYDIFTSWKIVTTYVTLLNELICHETDNDCQYNDMRLFPSFGVAVTRHLKEDSDEYSPVVHHRFATAFEKALSMLRIHDDKMKLEILRHMLNDDDFVPAYLVVSKIMPKDPQDETKHLQTEILQKLKINPSPVVQLSIMPPLMLAGDTVGQKRWHFNKLVADAVASKHYELTPIEWIDNLLKIEIACKARNVDYVIEVIKSKDMLYAATAIKKSTWLITDPQYAHIINPEYLHTQLKPYMTTKAFNKLMLHVRLNLKDESRVEAFYEYFKDTDSGCKWLQNCSIPFIENVIKNERRVPVGQFRRLCKRSARFLLYYTRAESRWGTTKRRSFIPIEITH